MVDGVSEYTLQQWNDEAGDYTNMGSGLMRNIVNMNTADEVSELPATGTAVIETNVSYNYWFIRDGKITTNALFNQQLNPTFTDEIWYPFQEIKRGGGQTVEPPAEEPVDLAQPEEGGDDEMTWDEIQNAPPSIPEGTSDEDLAGLLDG